MIKWTIAILILISCSSTPKKEYTQTSIEGRADEYSNIADSYRQKKMYKDALDYYESAAELYLLKGSKDKYAIIKIKQSIFFI